MSRWNEGRNHLLINMLPGRWPDFLPQLGVNTSKALVASGGFSHTSYRRTFDVTIPIYNTLVEHVSLGGDFDRRLARYSIRGIG